MRDVELVIAGGFDPGLAEQRNELNRLRRLAEELGVAERTNFELSPSNDELGRLLRSARALLHPACEEHFGIVLIEAMAMETAVIAVNNAGPSEIVVDGETGYLVAPNAAAFAERMSFVMEHPDELDRVGHNARARAQNEFSREKFAHSLQSLLQQTRRCAQTVLR